jgi:hypothetical protein
MIRVMREFFMVGGRKLSYRDFGGPGRPLLALHGHYSDLVARALEFAYRGVQVADVPQHRRVALVPLVAPEADNPAWTRTNSPLSSMDS